VRAEALNGDEQRQGEEDDRPPGNYPRPDRRGGTRADGSRRGRQCGCCQQFAGEQLTVDGPVFRKDMDEAMAERKRLKRKSMPIRIASFEC
jgi:hypothetical protein